MTFLTSTYIEAGLSNKSSILHLRTTANLNKVWASALSISFTLCSYN